MIVMSIVLFIIWWSIICYRACEMERRNPLPKFPNGDKEFKDVEMIKTRVIR